MKSQDLREKFLKFFEDRKHVRIDPAPLVLKDDPTTLFTSSGMQPLIPYLLGEDHSRGKRLVDSQPCFREVDIIEVGDNRHTTFFEMLGNWSLGDYFKEEEIPWLWEFLTKELNLPEEKLYISVFEGDEAIPKDEQSLKIWQSLGIKEDHIYFYGVEKNWWSRSGVPENMPVGEIGGPDTEVFYDFGSFRHDDKYGKECHPNCDCGRFMEIANSVFIQYKKTGDEEFEKLDQQNVDFGGGLERLLAATDDNPDIFETDLFKGIIHLTESLVTAAVLYHDLGSNDQFRVIADHIRASVFLIKDGVVPSNKLQGYVLRRLLRRACLELYLLDSYKENAMHDISNLVGEVIKGYQGTGYFKEGDEESIKTVIDEEVFKFEKTLENGLKEVEKIDQVSGKAAFDLYQSYGFPADLTEELLSEKGLNFDREEFQEEFKKHQELSRTASSGMFKGGLAGHSEVEVKYHTATHLLHQALRDVLGDEVFQKGSNITPERLRFDFSFDRKLTEDELKEVEDLVNQKIKEDLKVDKKIMTPNEAYKLNAIGLFNDKYAKEVSIYEIGPSYKLDPKAKDQRDRGGYYSLEFCGGPHVEHTGVIGGIKITKEESVSQGVRRIYAELS